MMVSQGLLFHTLRVQPCHDAVGLSGSSSPWTGIGICFEQTSAVDQGFYPVEAGFLLSLPTPRAPDT